MPSRTAYPWVPPVPYGFGVSSDGTPPTTRRSGPPWREGSPWRTGEWPPDDFSRRRGRGGRPHYHAGIGGAIIVAIIELAGVHFSAQRQTTGTQLDHLGYALILLGVAALPFRRRFRVAAFAVTLITTVAYVVLGYPYGPIFLALLISIFGAVRSGHRRAVWIGLAAAYAIFLSAGRIWPKVSGYQLRHPGLLTSIQVMVWFVLALVLAEAIRVRSAHFAEMRRTMAEQARARDEQERRQTSEERLRIAQELHDVLGHHLSLINVQAGVGLHLMADNPDQARAALEAIKQASTEALGEVRAVLSALRPKDEKAPRAPAPSLAGLDALVAAEHTVIIGTPRPLPPEVERAAFRIVQESMTNVRRHAGPGAIATVTIDYGARALSVRVVDDGRGGSETAKSGEGTGIAGMRTRAEALGGTLTAGPTATGFVVAASLPLTGPGATS
jgi:signal transduction histidine kinase